MIKAIIIDDELHCRVTLSLLLKENCPELVVLEQLNSAEHAAETIRKLKPDLIFLDIEMPVMSGFSLLEEFSEIGFAVIFTTGFDKYAIKAIRFSALDYLLKPIDPDELKNAVHKIARLRQLPEPDHYKMLLKQLQGIKAGLQKVAVPTAEGYELIAAEQVLYLEANNTYTYLQLKNGLRIIACRTLKEMEEQLQDFPFFLRVHNSYMVNLNEATRYVRGEGGYLVMTNGSTVSVSRSRKEELLNRL